MRLMPARIRDTDEMVQQSPEDEARLRAAARVLSLPCRMPDQSAHMRPDPMLVEAGDIWSAVPRVAPWGWNPGPKRLRQPIRVWWVGNRAELEQCVSELEAMTFLREARHWRLRDNSDVLRPGRAGRFVLAASRDGDRAEGILVGCRWTDVALHEGHLIGDYGVSGNFLFVTPKARSKLVAPALTSVLCDGIGADMRLLARRIAKAGLEIEATPSVWGEAYSRGGEGFFEDLLLYMRDGYVPPEGLGAGVKFAEPRDNYD